MRVTEVKVFPVADDKLKAFVSVVLDDCFMVNDIKVIEGRDGRFISMPSRRKRNGKFKDIAHPLNSDTRQMMESKILDEYERLLNGGEPSSKASRSSENRSSRRNGDEAAGDAVPAVPPAPVATPVVVTTEESSLEEVTKKHLSDSFWTS